MSKIELLSTQNLLCRSDNNAAVCEKFAVSVRRKIANFLHATRALCLHLVGAACALQWKIG